jgi:malonyl-CoA decarboxylase
MAQSNGAMVNYLYDLSRITTNHEEFVAEKSVIASADVKALSATLKSDA